MVPDGPDPVSFVSSGLEHGAVELRRITRNTAAGCRGGSDVMNPYLVTLAS